MRGDFEILGYNMIQWLCGSLLWEKDLSDPVVVQKQKEKAFADIPDFLNKSFNGSVPNCILQYMTHLASMKFNETPNYEKFKKILTEGLKQLSHKPDGKLEFKNNIDNHKPENQKLTPQKVKETVNKSRKSPRLKSIKCPSPERNLDDSNVDIVMDKKRGGAKDIKKVLKDIESDEEYDITIVKKSKKPINSVLVNKSKGTKTTVKKKKKVKRNYIDESISDSEPEVIRTITSFFNLVFKLTYSYNKVIRYYY